MSEALRPASLEWSQGLPFASDFGDVYFSRTDGAAESRHVVLDHNRLASRLAQVTAGQGFTIVETGFGTGLNFLVTLDLWRREGGAGWLHFCSVEKHPLTPADLARTHDFWPELSDLATLLQRHYPAPVAGFHRICLPALRTTLTLFLGDIADFLPRLVAQVDAWYLDGFAPARNPGMWGQDLYATMTALSRPGATFATFTAAGTVRRGLAAAGFVVEKAAGYGRKREMLHGRLEHPPARRQNARPWLQRPAGATAGREACVIGAGIAGAQTAHRLALRGWRVTVLEQEQVAAAGSGNPAAMVYGRLAAPGKEADHFSQQAWLFMLRELAQLPAEDSPWHPCGILQLATGNQAALAHSLLQANFPAEVAQALSPAEATLRAGVAVPHAALFYPAAGWLDARRYCRQLLQHPGISLREGCRVAAIGQDEGGWQLHDDRGKVLLRSALVIVATAGAATALPQLADLPLGSIRGQVSIAAASPATSLLRTVLCHDGYISPRLPDGSHCLGATFQPGNTDLSLRQQDHEANHALLAEALPELAGMLPPPGEWQGRTALRCQSPDYLPLVGPVADRARFLDAYAGLRDGKVMDYPELPVLPGLYVNVAHGSKGFSHAALAAELLAAEINGEPAPVSRAVLDALHPMRFRAREIRRGRQP